MELTGHDDPRKVSSRELTARGTCLRVWTGGEGPVLLLLHAGYGDAYFSWSRVWNELAQSFTVVAPDLPGFGRSERGAAETVSDTVHILADMLEQVRRGPAIIVGNSFGGAVAYRFAQEFPLLTRKLILVNGTEMPALPTWLLSMLKLPVLHDVFMRVGQSMYYSKKALHSAFTEFESLPEEVKNEIERNAERHSMISGDMWLNSEPNERRVRVPISMIWGEDDEMVPLKLAEGLQRRYPGSTIHTIPQARHMPEIERPQEFVTELRREAMS